jgi:CheY-like chemotaxis protein
MSSTEPFALVVDDDPMILMDACQILEDAGFRCHEAGTGDEAIQVIEQAAESVTLLFTDVEMPGGINGFQLASIVAERWPEIEIVVASGRMKPGPGDMPEKATFIGKPFSAQLVHDHLREKLPDGKKPEPLKSPV